MKPVIKRDLDWSLGIRWRILHCKEQQCLSTRYFATGLETSNTARSPVNRIISGTSLVKCWVLSADARSISLSSYVSCKTAEGFLQNDWLRGGRFIYLRISKRCGSVFFCLETASFPGISFVFTSKKHHLSSRANIKKSCFFVQSAICHSFHQSYVSALSTWSATNTVLFSRKDPLSFREVLNRFSVFVLFFLFFVWIQPQYFIRSG